MPRASRQKRGIADGFRTGWCSRLRWRRGAFARSNSRGVGARESLSSQHAKRGGLLEGRARDERDDGRRRFDASAVLGHSHRTNDPAVSGVDPFATARGRDLGERVWRTCRPLDDRRSVCGAASRRRSERRGSPRARCGDHPRQRRPRSDAGLHAHLARALRSWSLGGLAGAAAGADALAQVGAPQHLRFCVLGPTDDRPAHHRHPLSPASRSGI